MSGRLDGSRHNFFMHSGLTSVMKCKSGFERAAPLIDVLNISVSERHLTSSSSSSARAIQSCRLIVGIMSRSVID